MLLYQNTTSRFFSIRKHAQSLQKLKTFDKIALNFSTDTRHGYE